MKTPALTANDYVVRPGGKEGRQFDKFGRRGFMVLDVLPFLVGRPWNDAALGVIHMLRPTQLRVIPVGGGEDLMSIPWRVTVHLTADLNIKSIRQEVQIGIPSDLPFECGQRDVLARAMGQQDPPRSGPNWCLGKRQIMRFPVGTRKPVTLVDMAILLLSYAHGAIGELTQNDLDRAETLIADAEKEQLAAQAAKELPADWVDPYPEHTKLKAVSQQSQAQGALLDWLECSNIRLCEEIREYEFVPWTQTIKQILAKYHGIDLKKIDDEKVRMVDELRLMNTEVKTESPDA